MPDPQGSDRSHCNALSQSTETYSGSVPIHDPSSAEGQAFANLLSVPDIDGFIPQDVPLELEPWAQEVAAAPLVDPSVTAAGGGLSLSTGGSEDHEDLTGSRKRYTQEEIRRRRAERQRTYRKRRQNEVQVTEKSVQMVEDQLVVAREEQTALRVHASVLQKMVNYTEGALQAIKSLTEVAQQAISKHFQPAYEQSTCLIRLALMKAVIPTDSQIRTGIRKLSIEELETKVMEGHLQTANLLKTWESSPSSRGIVESQLFLLQDMRRRAAVILAEERPYIALELIQRRTMPLGADGRPNQMVRDALDATQLSPEQIEAIREQWMIYKKDTMRARRVALEAVWAAVGVCPTEGAGREDTSAAAAASGFLETVDTVSTLEKYPAEEALALLDLVVFWSDTLTPLQRGRVSGVCGEYLPDPLQFCTILFDEDKQTLEM